MKLRDYWSGHGEPKVEIVSDDGRVLARGFADESEARDYMAATGIADDSADACVSAPSDDSEA